MRTVLAIVLLLGGISAAAAQSAPDLMGPRTTAYVSVVPVAQIWEDGDDYFGEVSIPVVVEIPVGERVSLGLRALGAYAEGTNLKALDGLGDVQAAINVRQPLGRAVAVVSLGASLPSGKTELTNDEFSTSYVLGQNIFRFRTPTFGQGFNVTPGVMVAIPLSEQFAVGLGASYQYRGAYRPLSSFQDDYDPGDEVLLTGGLDVRVASSTFLSTDVVYTLYGSDTLGDQDVYASGDKVVATVQLRSQFGFNEFWLLGRYRSRAKSDVLVAGQLVPEVEKSVPNQFEVMGRLQFRLGPVFYLGLLGEGRFFDASATQEKLQVLGVGLAPQIALSRAVRLPFRFMYYTGDFRGGEAALGLIVSL